MMPSSSQVLVHQIIFHISMDLDKFIIGNGLRRGEERRGEGVKEESSDIE